MPVQDDDLAVTYSLIYSFLTGRSHFKAAEAVKKAAKDVTIIGGGDKDGPALPVIVRQWKKFTAERVKLEKASTPRDESTCSESSSSDSVSDSSAGLESEESESDTTSDTDSRRPTSNKRSRTKATPFPGKDSILNADAKPEVKPPTPKLHSKSAGGSKPSSDPESSDSDDSGVKNGVRGSTSERTKVGEITPTILPESDSGGSSNSDSDLSESEEGVPTSKAVTMDVNGTTTSLVRESRSPAGSSQTLPSVGSSDTSDSDSESSGSSTSVDDSSSASDSDSGDSSNSDGTSNTGKNLVQTKGKPRGGKVSNAANAAATAFPRKPNGPIVVTKKRRTNEAGSSIATSIVQQPKTTNPRKNANSEGQPRKPNTPFSRIKIDEVKFADERLRDNTFGSRRAATNDYGAKANADLMVTRGAGFRKEKNKKKRGSYRGGDITMESHSIKFTD